MSRGGRPWRASSRTVAEASMAISSVSGQTSTGGPSQPSRANQPEIVSDDRSRFRRHVHLLRLLCRSLDPTVRVMHEGERVHLVDVLKIPPGCRGPVGVLDLPQGLGRSQTIGRRGQKEARTERLAPLTAFAEGAWGCPPTGWEMQEHLDRERERKERADALARIDLEWPKGGG